MQQSGAIWKVLLLLSLMFVLTLLSIGLWILLFNGSQSTTSLKVMQMLQTIATFMLPCLIAAALWSNNPVKWLKLDIGIGWKESVLIIVLMLCASPCINLLAWLNCRIELPDFLSSLEQMMKSQETAAAQLTERFIKADNFGILLFNIFFMALLPAFSEELLFRGTLQQLFSSSVQNKHNATIAIWGSAIIFSAIHFQFYGFIPRMLMGALFGYLFVWSRSIWLPVLAHFTNNAMAVIFYNMYYMRGKNPEEIDSLGTGDTLWLGILSTLIVIGLIYTYTRIFVSSSHNRTDLDRF